MHTLALALPLSVVLAAGGALPAPAWSPQPSMPSGTWEWPVRGPVIHAFDPPETPFGAGHRGIDIAVPIGSPILAPAPGVVSFSGPVGGHLFVTIDHGGGLESTYSWILEAAVRKGDVVARGQPIGRSGQGHPGSTVPLLHFGVRLAEEYVDPMLVLGPLGVQDLIRLAPIAA